MAMLPAAARALLLRSSATAVAPLAAVAIVASRRFFSSHRSTAGIVASRRFFSSQHNTVRPAAAAIVASRRFFSSHHSTARPAAAAIVASRRFFSSRHSTAGPTAARPATNGGGEGDDAQRPIDGRIEETREQLLQLYLRKTPPPTTAEVASDLTGVFRRFQEAKARQQGPEEFEGEPFEGELFDTEAYEADASVAGYSFSGGTYTGGYHSGDIFMEDPHHVAGSGDSWR